MTKAERWSVGRVGSQEEIPVYSSRQFSFFADLM